MKWQLTGMIAGILVAHWLGIHRCDHCDGRGWVIGRD